MSIKIMSAIFATKPRDLKDAGGNVTKASTVKLVLLALADHADEGGKGAYPSLTRVEGKTGLNRRTIINALDALKHNGIISLVGRSKHNTNNYTILMQALPVTVENGAASTPPMVTPVHLNHPLTTLKPSNVVDESKTAAALKILTHLYETTIGAITPLMADLLRNAAIDFPAEWFEPAFEVAVKNNARRWIYIESILDGWKRNGFGWKPERAKTFFKPAARSDPTTLLLEYIKNGG